MVVKFLGKKIVHPKENPGYAYEKRVPDLRWYGAPRMVNPAVIARSSRVHKIESLSAVGHVRAAAVRVRRWASC